MLNNKEAFELVDDLKKLESFQKAQRVAAAGTDPLLRDCGREFD